MDDFTEYGDATKVSEGLILRVTAGSEVLGTAVEGTDDHDEMGIYVEPLTDVLRWRPPQNAYTFRTQPEGHRSGPGDTDYVAYPLRRYVELAMKGNPTMLVPLFAPRDLVLHTTPHGNLLREGRHRFLSVQTAQRFLGYMHAQRERMMGRGKQNRVPNRPELVEKYGWDTKYGAHSLRLALQAREVVGTGTLTLPLPDECRREVIGVRVGEYTKDEVLARVAFLEDECRDRLDSGDHALPPEPDRAWIAEIVTRIHRAAWGFVQPPF